MARRVTTTSTRASRATSKGATSAGKKAPADRSKASASSATPAGDGLAWTRETRAKVFGPRRPHPLDPAPFTSEAAWQAIRAHRGAPRLPALDELPVAYERRREKVLAELRRELASAELPPTATTVEREQMRAALLLEEGEIERVEVSEDGPIAAVASPLVAFWVQHLGVRLAAEVLFSPRRDLETARAHVGEATVHRVFVSTEMFHRPSLAEQSSLWWLELRRAVGRDVARARAATASMTMAAEVRAALWGDSGEAHRLATAPMRTVTMPRGKVEHFPASVHLLSAVTDPAIALTFARLAHPWNHAFYAGHHAFNVVDNLGPAAAPVLVSLLRQVKGGEEARRSLAEAAVLADPGHCRAVLRRCSDVARAALTAALGES